MARYIDADKLHEHITTNHCGECGIYNGGMCCSCPMDKALNYIEDFPTSDVVPRERFDRVFGNLKAVLEERAEDKAEVAMEIFEKIEKHLFVIAPIEEFDGWARIQLADIMRLKKKYTEAETEPPKGD